MAALTQGLPSGSVAQLSITALIPMAIRTTQLVRPSAIAPSSTDHSPPTSGVFIAPEH